MTGPARLITEPYPHAAVEGILGGSLSERVVHWLERDAVWCAERDALYEQYRCGNLLDLLCDDSLRMNRVLRRIAGQVEKVFGLPVNRRRIKASAQKRVTGQCVRPHTDVPHGLTETHRVVMWLVSPSAPAAGGELVLHGPGNAPDENVFVPPGHDRAVFMELSDRSYHSVLPVTRGIRYSLVLSYWATAATDSYSLWARRSPKSVPGHLLRLLEQLGALEVPHAGYLAECSSQRPTARSLSDHLVGTYTVLQGWGCHPEVCAAGLFHGLYGPAGTGTALLGMEDRHTLREAIGTRAEELVHLYAVLDRGSDRPSDGDRIRARLHGRCEPVDLEARTVANVFLLCWASLREQAPDVVLSPGETDELVARLDLFGSLIPDDAARDLKEVFAR
ncbi:hypothetical protein RKD47_006712 [Streptomyces albogriseolus]